MKSRNQQKILQKGNFRLPQNARTFLPGHNATPKIQIIFKNDNRLILPATTPEAQLLAIINSVAGLC